jgi:hypothetical protein
MMKDDLLQTKLQRSAVPPDVLPRDRLLERLEKGRHRPLTLISAPAGVLDALFSLNLTILEVRCHMARYM